MATTTILKFEHVDSLETWEGTEQEWEAIQPRIRAKYRKVGSRTSPKAPAEAGGDKA